MPFLQAPRHALLLSDLTGCTQKQTRSEACRWRRKPHRNGISKNLRARASVGEVVLSRRLADAGRSFSFGLPAGLNLRDSIARAQSKLFRLLPWQSQQRRLPPNAARRNLTKPIKLYAFRQTGFGPISQNGISQSFPELG